MAIAGNDLLYASFDYTILDGGDGDDDLRLDHNNFPGLYAQFVSLNGDAGNEWRRADADFTTLNGGTGGYLIVDSSANVTGGAPNDTVISIDIDGAAGPIERLSQC